MVAGRIFEVELAQVTQARRSKRMNRLLAGIVFIPTLFLNSGEPSRALSQPLTVYVDAGACPFECCVYREWNTLKNTLVLKVPTQKSEIVGKIIAGTRVNAVTGEVHTRPGKFRVKRDSGPYKRGHTIWVYTYLGEGHFKVWFNGKTYEESLDFSPYGGTSGRRCERGRYCFGELEKELEFTWWVKVKGPGGIAGWTDRPDHFGNKDACG